MDFTTTKIFLIKNNKLKKSQCLKRKQNKEQTKIRALFHIKRPTEANTMSELD